MAREIELKIRLDDPDTFRQHLQVQARLEGPYHKIDTYFRGAEGSFRLREASGILVVCRKEKTLVGGIEVNREIEFGVDDLEAFQAFAGTLGYKQWYRKEKRGEAWRWGEILVEVGTVSDLGWFAEFEIVLDDADAPGAVKNAQRALLEALDSLGISHDRLESKTYSQLLGHRGR